MRYQPSLPDAAMDYLDLSTFLATIQCYLPSIVVVWVSGLFPKTSSLLLEQDRGVGFAHDEV